MLLSNKLQRDADTQLFGREAALSRVMSNVSLSPEMMKWLPFWTAQAEIRAMGFFLDTSCHEPLHCLDSAGKAHLFNVSCILKKKTKKPHHTSWHTCTLSLSLWFEVTGDLIGGRKFSHVMYILLMMYSHKILQWFHSSLECSVYLFFFFLNFFKLATKKMEPCSNYSPCGINPTKQRKVAPAECANAFSLFLLPSFTAGTQANWIH